MPMAFQLLLVISGVESPTQATEDSENLAGGCQVHPFFVAVKKLDAQLLLKRLYVLRDGSLRNIVQFSSLCKAESFGSGDEIFQLVSGHSVSLSGKLMSGKRPVPRRIQKTVLRYYFNIKP